MSTGINLVSNGVQAIYIFPSSKCLPHPVTFRRADVSRFLCHRDCKLFESSDFPKIFSVYKPRRVFVACQALSNNNRRSPDSSRQHKGSSRGKSRQYQEPENSEILKESDLASKNGHLLSLSSGQRYQGNKNPERKEKEIVELFRKVQEQLRTRATPREEKKPEASAQVQAEKGTVDSLLKLLRKHSIDQPKHSDREEDPNHEQPERSIPFEEENPDFFGSSNTTAEVPHSGPPTASRPVSKEENSDFFDSSNNTVEVPHSGSPTASRPVSKFKRKSPVPRVKFQPIFSADDCSLSPSSLELENSTIDDEDLKTKPLDGSDKAPFDVPLDNKICEEIDTSFNKISNLSSLKLSELRDLAKSQGMKGYSKLKKGDLVELLTSSHT